MILPRRILSLSLALAGSALATSGTGAQVMRAAATSSARPDAPGLDAALFAESHLWRNFQPTMREPDSSLVAIVRVRSRDRRPLPQGVRVERISFRRGGETWVARPGATEPAAEAGVLEVIARGGPAWTPGGAVDVTVELRDRRGRVRTLTLRAQRIRRLD